MAALAEAGEGEADDPWGGDLGTGVRALADRIMQAEGLLPARAVDLDEATAEERRVLDVSLPPPPSPTRSVRAVEACAAHALMRGSLCIYIPHSFRCPTFGASDRAAAL